MTDQEKLKDLIDEIPKLKAANVTSSDVQFQAWHTKAERFLIAKYGEDSFEHKLFKETRFSLSFWTLSTPDSAFIQACKEDLDTTQAIFRTYLEELKEKEIGDKGVAPNIDHCKVFIVHGHDGELKHAVARTIEKQGIQTVILSEQINGGKTIIEKIEAHSDVGGAICLFTADDIGQKKIATEGQPRARQNVVFEAGYFMGKLGRDRVVFLADSGIELPSDLSGVVYTNTANWQVELLKELRAMGYQVDFNKLF